MSYIPQGIIVAMTTPMTADEKLCEQELRNQVRRYLDTGIHGLFCLGTNGEFYALSREEKLKVMEVVLEENRGRLPVCVGTGCVTTKDTVFLSQKAQELGADAVSVVTPYFGEVSQKKLVEHYKAVAKSIDIGVILYNIPARTGCSISRQTLETLAGVDNIIGIKDSSGNFDNTLQYLEATGREFPVLSGNDSLILSTLTAGGAGGIAGTANLFPNKLASIYDSWKAGDIKRAVLIQDGIRAIRDCMKLGNPNTVIKRAQNLLGWPVGPVRSPFGGDYEAWDGRIADVLDQYYKDWN